MAKLAAVALWTLLVAGVVLIVLMTWHPWVTPWTGTRAKLSHARSV